jgi:hypothetical protein
VPSLCNLTIQLHCREVESLEVRQEECVLGRDPSSISNKHGARVVDTATWWTGAIGRHIVGAIRAHNGAVDGVYARSMLEWISMLMGEVLSFQLDEEAFRYV